MRQEETEINIKATPEAVWKVMTDFDSFPDWNPLVTSASGEVKQGEILEVRIALPNGKPRTFKPRLLVVDSNKELRRLGTFLHSALFSGEHYFIMEPQESGGTRFLHGEKVSGLIIPAFSGGMNKALVGFEQMNLALKERVERAHGYVPFESNCWFCSRVGTGGFGRCDRAVIRP